MFGNYNAVKKETDNLHIFSVFVLFVCSLLEYQQDSPPELCNKFSSNLLSMRSLGSAFAIIVIFFH